MLLARARVEEGRDVAPGDQQCVSGGDGERIPKADDVVVSVEDP